MADEIRGLKAVNDELKRLTRQLTTARRKLLAAIGVFGVTAIQRNFEDMQSQWPPLSPATIAARRNKDKSSIKILIDTARLKNSIKHKESGDVTAIGTNVVYARAHQFGVQSFKPKTIQIQRATKKKGQLSLLKISKRGLATGKAQRLPARPFVFFTNEHVARIRAIVERQINSGQ